MKVEGNVRGIGVVAAALFVSFVFIAGGFYSMASKAAQPESPKPLLDNYLYVGMQDEPKSLNPTIPNDVWSSNFLGWMWDGTLSADPDDQSYQPWIATNWYMVGTDNKNFTVTYRFAPWTYVKNATTGGYDNKPIKFQDGHEVDIYDLLFSFELAMHIPRWVAGYEALDKTPNGTVIPPEGDATHAIHLVRGISMDVDPAKKSWVLHFRLNRTDAMWEANFVAMSLYPYHLWKDKYYAGQYPTWNIELETLENQRKYVIGSGAFKYNEWKKGGQYAQLDTYKGYFPWNKMPYDKDGKKPPIKDNPANPGTWWWETKKSPITIDPSQQAWGERQAAPYIDGIKYKIYYSVDTAILALKNGDVDTNWWTVDPGYISDLSSKSSLQLVTSEDTGFFYLTYNMRKPAFGYDDWNSPTRVDKGKIFRQVVAMCTDKDTIVKRLLMNYGTAGASVVSPSNTEWHNPNVKTYPFDPEGAKKLLDEAGYKKDGSGWYDLGSPVGSSEFELIHPTKDYDSVRYEAARMVVDQLRTIGVHVVSKPLQFGQVVERMNSRNFDMYILGWRLGTDPGYLYDFYHTAQAGPGLQNHPGYHNDSYDKLVEQSRAELDRSKRRDILKQAQSVIAEDCVYNVLYYRSNIEAYNKDRWAGWLKGTGGIMNGWSFNFLKKPAEYMNVKIESPVIMTEGMNAPFNIKVTSAKDGTPQAGATVKLSVSCIGKSPGGLGSATGSFMTNLTTDSNGIATVQYYAPAVPQAEYNRSIIIQATAAKTGYELSNGLQTMKVYTGTVKYVTASIDEKTSTFTIKKGETGTIRVNVVDQAGIGASGVSVKLTTEPATGVTLSKATATTDSSGKVLITYTANVEGTYTFTAEPQKGTEWTDAIYDTTSLTIMPPPDKPTDGGIPMWIYIVIAVVAVVAILVVVVVLMRKKSSI